jgi:hypothetical protein
MRYLVITTFSAAILYGSTYQSFRSFNLADPGGATDAIHYAAMARGELPEAPEVRHYRWLTPAAARFVEPFAARLVGHGELSIRLAFYLVNFSFSLLACVMLFRLFQALKFSVLLSLLGVCAFATSRVTVLATATPLVDAGYLCAIAVITCLTVEKKALLLALLMPLLVLGKETAIPFLLLPLVTDLRKSPAVWAGLAAAAAAFAISGQIAGRDYPGPEASYAATVLEHARKLGWNASRLLTPSGLHDFQNGFSLLLPLSVAGAWLNAKYHYRVIPLFIIATVPVAFVLALLSGNLGRMFFAAFPVVIAYALIAVEHLAGDGGTVRAARGSAYGEG